MAATSRSLHRILGVAASPPCPPAALAQAFASIGSCPRELLEAFANRAIELEQEQRLDVQVGL